MLSLLFSLLTYCLPMQDSVVATVARNYPQFVVVRVVGDTVYIYRDGILIGTIKIQQPQ